MGTTDVSSLARRLDEQKARKARALGSLDSIRAQWKAEFGVDTPEEIRKIKADMEASMSDLQRTYDDNMAEAERLIASAEAVR